MRMDPRVGVWGHRNWHGEFRKTTSKRIECATAEHAMSRATQRQLRSALRGYGFLSLNIGGFLMFTLVPVAASFLLSFYEYDNINPPRYVGLGNYIQLLGWHRDELGALVMNHPLFWHSLGNTLFMMLGLPVTIFCSLLIAMGLNRKLPGTVGLRTIYYLPTITPLIAIALIWFWIL